MDSILLIVVAFPPIIFFSSSWSVEERRKTPMQYDDIDCASDFKKISLPALEMNFLEEPKDSSFPSPYDRW